MTHYDVLEVSPRASPEVLRAAYRSLMQAHHPDRHPGDAAMAEKAACITQAYEVLSDPTRRAAYDARLAAAPAAPTAAASGVPPMARAPATAPLRHPAPPASRAAPPAPARPGGRWLLAAAAGLALAAVLAWSQRGAGPATEAPSLESLRRAMAAPGATEAERRALFEKKMALLARDPALRERHQQELLADRAAATFRLFDEPLVLTLTDEATATLPRRDYRLTLPALHLRLGTVDREKLLAHLGRQRERLQRRLADSLSRQSGSALLRAGGEQVLEGWILDTLDTELGTGRDDPWPTNFLESPGRYGVVALILPQSFAIEALGSP